MTLARCADATRERGGKPVPASPPGAPLDQVYRKASSASSLERYDPARAPVWGFMLARNRRPAAVALTSTPAPEVACGTTKPRPTASSHTASLGQVVRHASMTSG